MNGILDENLLFKDIRMDLDDISTWPIFQVTVFDYNRGRAHQPLGYIYL